MHASSRGTRETILVVDDNESVLNVVVSILVQANFRVLSAHNGTEALKLAKETESKIDLLLSDVEMPLLSGPDLGQAMRKSRPDLHVMLMSGGNNGGNLLVLNYGWAYIQKPFLAVKLVEMVTDVLHSPDRSQAGGQEFESSKDKTPDKQGPPLIGEAPVKPLVGTCLINLTERQHEILRYVGEGMSDQQVANTLEISVKTVEFHKANLRQRLGLHTTAALVRHAIRTGAAAL